MLSNVTIEHTQFLSQALSLAKLRRGFCAPNPAVGAIAVKDGRVLAEGYHWAAGYPHAEAEVLNQLGEAARGATLYVTLEPCCHYDKKTPPCTDAIIAHGIKEVIIGHVDPNPAVSGQGIARLQAAGIGCQLVALPEIEAFYQSYSHWLQTGLPWVTAKIALSLDGKIAGKNGEPIAITGPELKRYTHEHRKQTDAILTTVKTVICDDPQLNVRLGDERYTKPVYVLDRQLKLPLTAQLLTTASQLTLFHAADVPEKTREAYLAKGIKCIAVPIDPQQRLSLRAIFAIIGQHGRHDLWVEAGGQCFAALLQQQLLQRALVYVAPKWLGEHAQLAFRTEDNLFHSARTLHWQVFGNDVICEFRW